MNASKFYYPACKENRSPVISHHFKTYPSSALCTLISSLSKSFFSRRQKKGKGMHFALNYAKWWLSEISGIIQLYLGTVLRPWGHRISWHLGLFYIASVAPWIWKTGIIHLHFSNPPICVPWFWFISLFSPAAMKGNHSYSCSALQMKQPLSGGRSFRGASCSPWAVWAPISTLGITPGRHFFLPPASSCNLQKWAFFPCRFIYNHQVVDLITLAAGQNFSKLCSQWYFILDHKGLFQAVAGRRNGNHCTAYVSLLSFF